MRTVIARATFCTAAAFAAFAALALFATPSPAQPQTWPQRPVKFIVPFGPGAGADIGARLIADRLPARWGKAVVVENRPGADGIVSIQAFVTANDDHTLWFGPSGSFTVHPFQYEKLPYAPGDLVPIARVSNTILAVGVPEAMKIGTLADFVARAKAEPGKLNAAVVPGITEFPALEVEGLVGLFGPAGMPLDLRERIAADIRAIAADPAISSRLAGTAQVVNPGGPAEFAAAVEDQRAKIAKIAQTLGLKPKQ
jgi:tripartite-type tricarboxylate transporter receptor subunit TctC